MASTSTITTNDIAQKDTILRACVKKVEIYSLSCPITGEVRYIGKANDSVKRLASHLRDMKTRKTPVYNWIRKVVTNGGVPVLNVLHVCSESEDWRTIEREYIAKYRASNSRLMNVADGGDEPYCPTETRAKNGAMNAKEIHSDKNSLKRRMWGVKKYMGDHLIFLKRRNNIESYNRNVFKLKVFAGAYPELWGAWAKLKYIPDA